jgi:hypothetical protein
MALGRCTTLALSQRTRSSRYGLQSCERDCAGFAKERRELISHPDRVPSDSHQTSHCTAATGEGVGWDGTYPTSAASGMASMTGLATTMNAMMNSEQLMPDNLLAPPLLTFTIVCPIIAQLQYTQQRESASQLASLRPQVRRLMVHSAEIAFRIEAEIAFRIEAFCGACTASELPAPPAVHLRDTLRRYRELVYEWRT